MHQGLSPPWFITPRRISATRNKIPYSLWVVIKCPAPGKTKLIKFPPSRAGKDVKCPRYARGGMCFDLTGTLIMEHCFFLYCCRKYESYNSGLLLLPLWFLIFFCFRKHQERKHLKHIGRSWPRGGTPESFWIGVCREGSWTLTLFKD